MAGKKLEITLIIPAEFELTKAEVAALEKSIKVQMAEIVKSKKYPGDIDPGSLDINVPPNKPPKRRRKPQSAPRKSSRKAGTKKN